MPELILYKNIYQQLYNRYSKNISIRSNLQWQFYNQDNNSVHSFQDYKNNYRKFVPEIKIEYANNQFGAYQVIYSLSYAKSIDYPRLGQLVPLVDSSRVYMLLMANRNLKPYDKHEVSLGLSYHSLKANNPIHYDVNLSGGFINNAIVDSSIIDKSGRRIHYYVNADGYKYLAMSGSLSKAFEFKENQIQLHINSNVRAYQNPSYLNGYYNLSKGIRGSGNVKVNYTLKNWLAINLSQRFSFYTSTQTGLDNKVFKNKYLLTNLGVNANLTKRLNLGSNINFNYTSSSGSEAIDFTIWNATMGYRLFKRHNGEIKLSVLDILHENTSIINSGSNNTLTRGTTNVLHNYFMLTFSYFPRKFGESDN